MGMAMGEGPFPAIFQNLARQKQGFGSAHKKLKHLTCTSIDYNITILFQHFVSSALE